MNSRPPTCRISSWSTSPSPRVDRHGAIRGLPHAVIARPRVGIRAEGHSAVVSQGILEPAPSFTRSSYAFRFCFCLFFSSPTAKCRKEAPNFNAIVSESTGAATPRQRHDAGALQRNWKRK